MRKLIVALGMTTAVCLSSAAVAFADGAPPPIQAATQSATTAQQAAALSSAQQVQPQNVNVSIRINSPGDDGDVTQTNSVGSTANAGNQATTSQTANQSPSGGGSPWWPIDPTGPEPGARTRGPSAVELRRPAQPSTAPAAPSTTQGNTAGSEANAGNDAGTRQGSDQSQGSSCGCDGSNGGVQSVNQQAGTEQAALAASKAVQVDPKNQNVSIRINSPGNDGNVTQTNSVTSTANAGNAASTEQHASQGQAAEKCGCDTIPVSQDSQPQAATQPQASNQPESSAPATDSAAAPASSSAPSVQSVGQDAATQQTAIAGSAAIQKGASNANYPIRINSGGQQRRRDAVEHRQLRGERRERREDASAGEPVRRLLVWLWWYRHPGSGSEGGDRAGRPGIVGCDPAVRRRQAVPLRV